MSAIALGGHGEGGRGRGSREGEKGGETGSRGFCERVVRPFEVRGSRNVQFITPINLVSLPRAIQVPGKLREDFAHIYHMKCQS
eukprot:750501-Hanusia_phi.AAC.3